MPAKSCNANAWLVNNHNYHFTNLPIPVIAGHKWNKNSLFGSLVDLNVFCSWLLCGATKISLNFVAHLINITVIPDISHNWYKIKSLLPSMTHWQRGNVRYRTCSIFLGLLCVVHDRVLVVGTEGCPLWRVQVYTLRGWFLQSVDVTHQPVCACLALLGAHVLLCPPVKPRLELVVQSKRHLLMCLQQGKSDVKQQSDSTIPTVKTTTTNMLTSVYRTFQSSSAFYITLRQECTQFSDPNILLPCVRLIMQPIVTNIHAR